MFCFTKEQFTIYYINSFLVCFFNPLTPGAFWKTRVFWGIWAFFKLDFGQISFNLVENAFATRQHALLTAGITLYDILARVCAEIKILSK